MNYINPIEILKLQAVETTSIDNSVIKKAKRILFADIDLSDDEHLNYKGYKLTKSDCERAIDELEDKNKVEFFSHLANNRQLNEFLANGNHELFNSFKQESIYKLPEFIIFLSPYFSVKIDRVLLKTFQDNYLELFTAVLRTGHLLNQSDFNNAYKSLSNEIQGRIKEIDKITESIKEEESDYTEYDIDEVVDIVNASFPIEFLNALPIYFQSQINIIADSINYLQLTILYEFNTTAVCLNLLEHLLKLNIKSLSKPTFEDNYSKIKEKHQERVEQEKNAPVIKEWAKILLSVQSKVEEVEEERLKSNSVCQFVNDLISIKELNKLPSFADEIRTQIGYSMRSLSIACWNDQSDINSALSLIRLALKIEVPEQVNLKFKQDHAELEELEKKYKGILVCYFCENNPPDEGCDISTTIYKETKRTLFSSRVQFSYTTINIPRCRYCREIHSKGGKKFRIVFFGCIIAGAIIGAMIEEHYIIGAIIGAVVGWGAGSSVQNSEVSKGGIKDDSEVSLAKHPLLVDRMEEGWTFSEPSA